MARLLCLCLLAVTSAARAQSAAPARSSIEPGTYDLEIVFGGGTVPGVLEIGRVHDSLTVALHVGDHESSVIITEQRGNRLTLANRLPGTSIRFQLEFTGDTVAGEFSFEEQPGKLTGRRRSDSH